MTLDEMWTRALADLLAWAYDDDVSLVHVWGAISNQDARRILVRR
jgi:hypothetical protein